jgi:hypothetical protein
VSIKQTERAFNLGYISGLSMMTGLMALFGALGFDTKPARPWLLLVAAFCAFVSLVTAHFVWRKK